MIKGIPQERYARGGYGATANLAVPAALFRAVGGFDGTRLSGGDAEFCRRAGRQGAQIAFAAAARVGHPARDSWEAISTKSRRVVGGQVLAGPVARRTYRVLRILMPPLLRCARIALTPGFSLRNRLVATGIQLRLWIAEIAELVRLLLAGGRPERR
jgi:hypothetical protein